MTEIEILKKNVALWESLIPPLPSSSSTSKHIAISAAEAIVQAAKERLKVIS